jgi:hypothetical protein
MSGGTRSRTRNKKDERVHAQERRTRHIIYAVLLAAVGFLILNLVRAATPNPGHPWTDIGSGTFNVAGPTIYHTYTFPDATSTVLTDNAAVTVGQGGTGTTTLTGVLLGNGSSAFSAVSILTAANGGTGNGFAKFAGPTTAQKTFTLPDATSTILTDNAAVTLAQGGTGANIAASNGGIFYSGASVAALLAGTSTANRVLLSGASAAPNWSFATYPSTAGTSGNFLVSDGTNWVSTAPGSINTIVTRPASGFETGVLVAATINSSTTRNVGLFFASNQITINQLTFNVGTVTTAGTMKICIYTEDGATKKLDITASTTVSGNNVETVSPAVVLPPDNYYIVIGCAATCNDTVQSFTETLAGWINGTTTPAGKMLYSGTVTHTAGTCNTALGTITGSQSKMPAIRLDN